VKTTKKNQCRSVFVRGDVVWPQLGWLSISQRTRRWLHRRDTRLSWSLAYVSTTVAADYDKTTTDRNTRQPSRWTGAWRINGLRVPCVSAMHGACASVPSIHRLRCFTVRGRIGGYIIIIEPHGPKFIPNLIEKYTSLEKFIIGLRCDEVPKVYISELILYIYSDQTCFK